MMIISASRRTDIAALYLPWLMNRLREGYALVERPRQPGVLERVDLRAEAVDIIAFISKNPAPLLAYIDELTQRGYRFFVQFTLTGYDGRLEPNLPPMEERVRTFRALGERIGRERLDWRYDPIVLDDRVTVAWHLRHFAALCDQLAGYTGRVIISFVDDYAHLRGAVRPVSQRDMLPLAQGVAETAARYQLSVYSCAEAVDLASVGVAHGACLDGERISGLLGYDVSGRRDSSQRPACRCVPSIDLGSYDTCIHGCRYCYATTSTALARARHHRHDPRSPLLSGWPTGAEQIIQRQKQDGKRQLRLF